MTSARFEFPEGSRFADLSRRIDDRLHRPGAQTRPTALATTRRRARENMRAFGREGDRRHPGLGDESHRTKRPPVPRGADEPYFAGPRRQRGASDICDQRDPFEEELVDRDWP